MKPVSDNYLENYSWMLDNFGINADPKQTVKNALKSHHGNNWQQYWDALMEYRKKQVTTSKTLKKKAKKIMTVTHEDFVKMVRQLREAQIRYENAKAGSAQRTTAYEAMVPLAKAVDAMLQFYGNPQPSLFANELNAPNEINILVNMPEYKVKVIKKADDPLTTKVSAGGDAKNGYYTIVRGNVEDVLKVCRVTLDALLVTESELRKQPKI